MFMFTKQRVLIAAASFALTSLAATAAEPDTSQLQKALGGATPDSIAETAVPGLYEVTVNTQIVYLSQDGRYVLQGELVDLSNATNVTEQKRKTLRLAAIDKVGEDNMVVFAPEQPAGCRLDGQILFRRRCSRRGRFGSFSTRLGLHRLLFGRTTTGRTADDQQFSRLAGFVDTGYGYFTRQQGAGTGGEVGAIIHRPFVFVQVHFELALHRLPVEILNQIEKVQLVIHIVAGVSQKAGKGGIDKSDFTVA